MATTPNMGLTVWTGLSDRFNHEELAENFQTLDGHDHAGEGGVKIPAGGIDALAIAENNYQDLSVTEQKLADLSVGTGKLKDGAVTTGKIANEAVTLGKLSPSLQSDFQDAIDVALADLEAMTLNPEDWKVIGSGGNPTFSNSWTNIPGISTAAYYKDPHKRVWLRGGVIGGTFNLAAFTLPTGYRPAGQEIFSSVQGRFDVMTNGDIIPQASQTGWVSFSGMSFRVA